MSAGLSRLVITFLINSLIYLLTGMHHLHFHRHGDLSRRGETPYDNVIPVLFLKWQVKMASGPVPIESVAVAVLRETLLPFNLMNITEMMALPT